MMPLLLLLFQNGQPQPPVYSSIVRVPVALAAPDGATRLPAGAYRIEVQGTMLRFFEGAQKRIEIRATAVEDRLDLHGWIPLAGAQFLRSSADPLPTGQERQFSKTGAPQYAEEKRDWKGVLRFYRGGSEVWLVFSERAQSGTWSATTFRLIE